MVTMLEKTSRFERWCSHLMTSEDQVNFQFPKVIEQKKIT